MGDIAQDLIDIAFGENYDEFVAAGVEAKAAANYKVYDRPRCCKYCGQRGLHWGMHHGNWRLFTENDELHSCLGTRR